MLSRFGCLALLISVSGCKAWRSESPPLVTRREGSLPSPVRLTLTRGREFVAYDARIRLDTLYAQLEQRSIFSRRAQLVIPIRDIVRIDSRRVDAGKTVAAGIGSVLGVTLVAYLAILFALTHS